MCVLSVGLSAHCRTGARWLPSHTVSEGVCGTMRAEANYLNEARAGKASRRELCLLKYYCIRDEGDRAEEVGAVVKAQGQHRPGLRLLRFSFFIFCSLCPKLCCKFHYIRV